MVLPRPDILLLRELHTLALDAARWRVTAMYQGQPVGWDYLSEAAAQRAVSGLQQEAGYTNVTVRRIEAPAGREGMLWVGGV